MSTLFVGNCTLQAHKFLYRFPGSTRVNHVDIPSGQQRQVGHDLADSEIAYIVGQHKPYGLINESDIPHSRSFQGLCYKIGKPITADRLAALANTNVQALEEKAQKNLENEAAALANSLSVDGKPLPRVEIETIENVKPGQKPKVSKGVEAVRDDQAPRHASGRRKAK